MFAKSRLKFIGKEVLCNGLLCVQCAPIKEIKFVAQSVIAFQSSTQKSKCWESRIVIYFLQILLEVKTKLHEITNKLTWFSCNLSSTLLLAVVLLFEFCMQLSIKLTNSCKGLNFSKCQLVNVKNFQPFLRHFYWWSVRDKDKRDFLLVYQRVSKRQLPEVYSRLWNLSTPSILAYEQTMAFGFYLASQSLITPSAAAHGKNYWNPCLPGSSFAYRILYLHCLRSFKNQIITFFLLSFFYCYTENMPELQRIIRLAMNDWESKTCIKFIERTNEKDYVNFFRGTQ